jgi:hypothetical protein
MKILVNLDTGKKFAKNSSQKLLAASWRAQNTYPIPICLTMYTSLGDHGLLPAGSANGPNHGHRRELPRPTQKFRRSKTNFRPLPFKSTVPNGHPNCLSSNRYSSKRPPFFIHYSYSYQYEYYHTNFVYSVINRNIHITMNMIIPILLIVL